MVAKGVDRGSGTTWWSNNRRWRAQKIERETPNLLRDVFQRVRVRLTASDDSGLSLSCSRQESDHAAAR